MKTKSTARLVYEVLLGEPADERSAYPFADALRAYASTRPAPSAKFFGYYLKRHELISDKRGVKAFTLKHVQLRQNEELDFVAHIDFRCTHYMSCFAGFVGEGGLLLTFKDLLEFDRAMWNGEQHERFGKLIRPSFWRALDAYGVPLKKIAQTVLEWSQWWRKEVATIEAKDRLSDKPPFQHSPAYASLLGKNKLRLLLAFEELNKSVDEALSAHVETMSPPRLFRRDEGCLRALERRLSGADLDGAERGCAEASDGRSRRAAAARRGAGGVFRRVSARRALSVRFSRAKSKGAKAREASRRKEQSGSASPGDARGAVDVIETPPRAPSSAASSSFPDLELEGTAGGVPYLRLPEPGADFTNSKNERAQLSAWIATLEREKIAALLRKLSTYREGSLYQFMLVWCQAAEGFNPLTGEAVSTREADYYFKSFNKMPRIECNDDGRMLWKYIDARSESHGVDLGRLLHFLVYLYSNDRLSTRFSSYFAMEERGPPADILGRPGELARKMTYVLRYCRYQNASNSYRGQVFKSELHRRAALDWQESFRQSFAMIAPGWVDYMTGDLGSIRRALRFPPFDEDFPSRRPSRSLPSPADGA